MNYSPKDLRVAPVTSTVAREFVKSHHYSGKVSNNSQLHLGVFLPDKRLHGVLQFGPPMDKSKLIGLVRDTKWNDFLELNRMVFDDSLPRNSESRALGVALRMIRKSYPSIEWIVSFADGTQCGDGTIYRASGFVLTQIQKNRTIGTLPGIAGAVSDMTLKTATDQQIRARMHLTKGPALKDRGGAAVVPEGFTLLPGFMLRYLYFLNPAARGRLTCDVLPFSAIDEAGARMYRGQRGEKGSTLAPPAEPEGGSIPTSPLPDRSLGALVALANANTIRNVREAADACRPTREVCSRCGLVSVNGERKTMQCFGAYDDAGKHLPHDYQPAAAE